MEKENLTLTEAIRNFNERRSARSAEQLHALFPVSDYLIPVAADHLDDETEQIQRLESMDNVPFLVIQHPEVGNYIPVFTCEEEAQKASLPENSVCARTDFNRLVDILRKTGPNIQSIIFDPAENALIFGKQKFLKYADDLLGNNKKVKTKHPRQLPEGEITEICDGAKKIDKNVIRLLKKEARKDSRIKKAWLVRQTFENGATVWNLILESPNQMDSLLAKYAGNLAPHILKKDYLQPAFVSEEMAILEGIEPFYLI